MELKLSHTTSVLIAVSVFTFQFLLIVRTVRQRSEIHPKIPKRTYNCLVIYNDP
jgi:hypothetical protein